MQKKQQQNKNTTTISTEHTPQPAQDQSVTLDTNTKKTTGK